MMKKVWFMLAMMVYILASCSDGGSEEPITPTPNPEEVKTEITIDSGIISNGLSFGATEGEQSISFSVNANWTLSIASTTSGTTWCKASATNGSKGTASVKFTVSENTDYEDRSVSVTIKAGAVSKTFTITQKGEDALLVTTPKYEVEQEGGQIEIEIKANISYQMEISEDAKSWITEVESKGRALTTNKHKLNVAMNEDDEKREGEITFKSDDKVETVKVYQAGGAILLLSQNEYNVSDKGDTISVDIKSNIDFGVQMPDVDWIIDEASSRGLSSHTLKYIVSANEGYDSRSADIVFYDKNGDLKDTLKVVQAQKDAIILSQKEIVVGSEGETIEVKLSANVDFEIVMPGVDWITQVESRALKEHTLLFKVAENTSEDNRSAEIVIKDKNSDLKEVVVVEQYGVVKAGYADGVVTIATAGTMKELLGDDYLNITSLKVVGPINGDDVVCLRQMLGASEFEESERGVLTMLNLWEANVIEGGKWYYEDSMLEYFYTSNNVIGDCMFRSCTNLTEIILPNGATSIGNSAFRSCSSLTSIDISERVISIGNYAFTYCRSLTSIDIPNTVYLIGDYAFYDCQSLVSIDIPNEVDSIGDYVFYGCSSFTSIDIPAGVTSIGNSAFNRCTSLISVSMGAGVTYIGATAFYNCSSLTSINIPNGVTTIGNFAFSGCSSLPSIDMPDGITSIGSNAFQNCSSLTSFDIPAGITSIDGFFSGCSSLTFVNIPDGVTSIGGWAFYGCSSLLSIDIPKKVTSIGECAFYGCSSLVSINIPDEVTSIGAAAFSYCSFLTSINIPDGVISIGENAFYECFSLTSVSIPNGVTSIGDGMFYGCLSLTDLYCYATTPPTISYIYNESFPKYGESTTLYVPKECGTMYKKSDWGAYFKTIKEME